MPLFTGLAKNMTASYFCKNGFPAEVRPLYVPTLWFNVDQLLILHVKSMFGKYGRRVAACMYF
jgi:hypothetical protein